MKINDKLYDFLKFIGLVVIPTFLASIIAISEIWNFELNVNFITLLSFIEFIIGLVVSTSHYYYYKNKNLIINNDHLNIIKVHTFLLKFTLYLVPALAVFYYVISLFINMPYSVQIIETLITIQVFLGIILGTHSHQGVTVREYIKIKINEFYYIMEKLFPSKWK